MKKKDNRVRLYFFSVKWLWKNREWESNRHKFKRMSEDYERYLNGFKCKYL